MSDEQYYWEKAEFQDPVSHRMHVDNYKKGIRSSVAFDEEYAKEASEELKKDCEYPIYYPPVSSCAYDEHENDMYYIGDSEEVSDD